VKTYELFIYGDIHCITNSFCKCIKIETPLPVLRITFSINVSFIISVFLLHTIYRKIRKYNYTNNYKVKIKFNLQQAMKAHRESKCIALLFL
jgi:hypothetical protein